MVGTKEQTNEDQTTANFSVSPVIAVDLLRAVSAERERSSAEYCPRSRCLGGWFGLERRLRHSRQGWLPGKYRPGAGDIVQRRCGGDQAYPRSARWTMHSRRSQLWRSGNYRSGNGSIGCWFSLHRGPHAGCWSRQKIEPSTPTSNGGMPNARRVTRSKSQARVTQFMFPDRRKLQL